MKTTEAIKTWIRNNAGRYETATDIVEGAVVELDLPMPAELDPIWEWALAAKPAE